jgi:hypothetical protein
MVRRTVRSCRGSCRAAPFPGANEACDLIVAGRRDPSSLSHSDDGSVQIVDLGSASCLHILEYGRPMGCRLGKNERQQELVEDRGFDLVVVRDRKKAGLSALQRVLHACARSREQSPHPNRAGLYVDVDVRRPWWPRSAGRTRCLRDAGSPRRVPQAFITARCRENRHRRPRTHSWHLRSTRIRDLAHRLLHGAPSPARQSITRASRRRPAVPAGDAARGGIGWRGSPPARRCSVRASAARRVTGRQQHGQSVERFRKLFHGGLAHMGGRPVPLHRRLDQPFTREAKIRVAR